MTVNLYTFVGLYDRLLGALSHLLDKGEAFATAQGESGEAILDWRLIDDMHPLRFQAMVVVNFTRSWTARVIGAEPPAGMDQASDLAGFRAAIADARAHLGALTPAQFDGRDDVPLTVQITDTLEPTMPAGQWLAVFASTNIYFHFSMVYAILRAKGAPIGKIDLFGGGL